MQLRPTRFACALHANRPNSGARRFQNGVEIVNIGLSYGKGHTRLDQFIVVGAGKQQDVGTRWHAANCEAAIGIVGGSDWKRQSAGILQIHALQRDRGCRYGTSADAAGHPATESHAPHWRQEHVHTVDLLAVVEVNWAGLDQPRCRWIERSRVADFRKNAALFIASRLFDYVGCWTAVVNRRNVIRASAQTVHAIFPAIVGACLAGCGVAAVAVKMKLAIQADQNVYRRFAIVVFHSSAHDRPWPQTERDITEVIVSAQRNDSGHA